MKFHELQVKSSWLVAWLACLPVSFPSGVADAGTDPPYHIVMSRNALAAGEEARLQVVPPLPEGVRAGWFVTPWQVPVPDTGGVESAALLDDVYRAPLLISADHTLVTIHVAFSGRGIRGSASIDIHLTPSAYSGADDCLGPGQTFSPLAADILPGYTPVDELPEVLQRVAPIYPRSALVRGVAQGIPTRALVCRTGHVLYVQPLPSFDSAGVPIEHDPKLIEAAVAAVQQWVFKPARKSGTPIATWVTVPVAFKP